MRAVTLLVIALPVVSAAVNPLSARNLFERRQDVPYTAAAAQDSSTAGISPNATSDSSSVATSVVIVDIIPAISRSTVYSYKQITVTSCETESKECTKTSPDLVTTVVPVTTTMCPITWTISYVSDFTKSIGSGTWPMYPSSIGTSNWVYDSEFTEVSPTIGPYTNSSRYQSLDGSPMTDGPSPYTVSKGFGSQTEYFSTAVSTMAGDRNNYALPYSGTMNFYSSPATDASYASSYADLESSAADMSTITQTQSSTTTVTRNSQSNSSEGSPEQRTSLYEPSTLLKVPCSDCSESATVVAGVMYAMSGDLTTTITGEITSLVVVTLFRDGDYLIAPTEYAVSLSRSVTVDAVRGGLLDGASEPDSRADLLTSSYLDDSSELYALIPPGSILPYTSTWNSPVGSLEAMTDNEVFSSSTPTEPSPNIDISPVESVSAEETMLMWPSDGTRASTSPTIETMRISTPARASSSVGIPILSGPLTVDGTSTSLSDTTGSPEENEIAETEISEETESLREPGPVRISTTSQETEPVEESRTEETGTSTGDFEDERLDIELPSVTGTLNTGITAVTDDSVDIDASNETAVPESVNSETDVTSVANALVADIIPDDIIASKIDTSQTVTPDLDTTDTDEAETDTSVVADGVIGTGASDESDSSAFNNSDMTDALENYFAPSESDTAETNSLLETDVFNSFSVITDENFTPVTVTLGVTGMPEQTSAPNEMTGSVETDILETEGTEGLTTPDETVTFEETEASDIEDMSQETEDSESTATTIAMEGSSEGSPIEVSESLGDVTSLDRTSTSAPTAVIETSNTLVSSEDVATSGEMTVPARLELSEELSSSEVLQSTVVSANLEELQSLTASENSEGPVSVEETPGSLTSEASAGSASDEESDEESETVTETRPPEETDLSQTSAVPDSTIVKTLAEIASPVEEAQTVEGSIISPETSLSEEFDSTATPSSVTATTEGSDETEEPSNFVTSSILVEMSSDEDETSATAILPETTESSMALTGALQPTDTSESDVTESTSASTEAEESRSSLELIDSPSVGTQATMTSNSSVPSLTEVTLQPVSDNSTILSSENDISSSSSTDATVLSTFISSAANATGLSTSTAIGYMMSQSISDSSGLLSSIEVDATDNSTATTPNSLVADANSPTSLMSPVESPQSTSTTILTAISTLMGSANETMESTRSDASINSMTVSNSTFSDGGSSSNNDNNDGANSDSAGTTVYGPLSTSRESGPVGTGSVPAMYASSGVKSMKAGTNVVFISFSAGALAFVRW